MSDLASITEMEQVSHKRPWSSSGIARELEPSSPSLFWVVNPRNNTKEIRAYICFRILGYELYILNLCVHRAYRRQGYATWLCRKCFSLARSRGVRRAVLDVHRDNGPAEAFYKKLGFSYPVPMEKNKKIFLVMEMQFSKSCLDFNIEAK